MTPAYAVAIMAFTCLLPYVSDGPNWKRESSDYFHSCKSYWWTNLLYINNFYKSLNEQVCASLGLFIVQPFLNGLVGGQLVGWLVDVQCP